MGAETGIEWTDATWNPIVGCSVVSPGCTNCYAMKMAARIEKMRPPERRGDVIMPHHYTALTTPSKAGPVWTGRVNIAPDHILVAPLHWKKPRRIFVNSMSDLFHESVPDEWIARVFAVMALCPQHTFQVLTKRSARMRKLLRAIERPGLPEREIGALSRMLTAGTITEAAYIAAAQRAGIRLSNVWLGVSAEDQQRADERIPDLLATPAAVRFVSAEPLLGPVDLTSLRNGADLGEGQPWLNALGSHGTGYVYKDADTCSVPRLDWVICGGESGPNARPMHPDWARSLRDQCHAAGVPFFFKQWGESAPFETGEAPGHWVWRRVGKKAAGAMLDGREWREFPQ